jgi:hypothetical protein
MGANTLVLLADASDLGIQRGYLQAALLRLGFNASKGRHRPALTRALRASAIALAPQLISSSGAAGATNDTGPRASYVDGC